MNDIKSKINQEFLDLMRTNNNDYKKCILIMTTSRLYYLLNVMEAIIEFGPIKRDKEIISNMRKELYELEVLLTKEELLEIEKIKKEGLIE